MTNAPTCAHCGREMPMGATFGPDDWTPWQRGNVATFVVFCPTCRAHNPIATATKKQQRRTYKTMLKLTGEA